MVCGKLRSIREGRGRGGGRFISQQTFIWEKGGEEEEEEGRDSLPPSLFAMTLRALTGVW